MKRILIVAGVCLLVYWVWNSPNGAAGSVENIGALLRDAADSMIVFFRDVTS